MIKILKKIIKKNLFNYLRKENRKIKDLIINFKIDLNILDIGATGGIQKKWHLIEEILNVSLVEANKNSSFGNNKFKSKKIITQLFSSKSNELKKFYITKYSWCSSVDKPNYSHLNKFKGKIGFFTNEGFKIEKALEIKTTTVDDCFIDEMLDFIKIDAEGHHIDILKGAGSKMEELLGLEVECEFFQLRENQKMYFDVINYLEKYDFEFIDFLNIHRWERDKFRYTGQPQHSDILFLKKPEDIINKFNEKKISQEKLLKYIIILSVYNRSDLIKFINDNLDKKIVNDFKLSEIYNLTEKKLKRLNKMSHIENIISNAINNEI